MGLPAPTAVTAQRLVLGGSCEEGLQRSPADRHLKRVGTAAEIDGAAVVATVAAVIHSTAVPIMRFL